LNSLVGAVPTPVALFLLGGSLWGGMTAAVLAVVTWDMLSAKAVADVTGHGRPIA
jgi:hypothetical protein